MITEKMKETLSSLLSNYPIVINQEPNQAEWLEAKSPRCIIEMERANGYVAAFDTSYGLTIVFSEDGEECSWGKNSANLPGVICLNKEYYGIEKYLWF